jgi:hypothetical protein
LRLARDDVDLNFKDTEYGQTPAVIRYSLGSATWRQHLGPSPVSRNLETLAAVRDANYTETQT